MSTTLPHGIIQINEGNIAWYGDITSNWQLIDSKIGIYDAAIASIPAPANNGTLTINYGGTTIAMFGANDAGNVTADIPAPGDGTLTVTQGGSTLGTFTANQATAETIDIPAPGDGTLTIQQNGANVQTFTANASTNATANIQCVDLTSAQTIAGDKDFTGTTGTHDVVPATTDTYDLGSSAAQWNNAYIKSLTINGVACGDILTHNASEFVDVSSNQTIGGVKTFTGYVIFNPYSVQIKNSSQEIGVVPASYQWNGFGFTDKNNSYTFSIEQAFLSNGNTTVHFSMTPNIASGSLLRIFESIYYASTDTIETKSRTLVPDENNSRDLGTSTNKWKSFNGLNPGALSLWSGNYISLDTTGFDVTAATIGAFTPTVDGWAILSISQKNKPFGIWILSGSYRVTFYSVYHDSDYMIFALIPVRAGVAMTIYCTADDIDSTRKVDWLRLFPCQGNV